MKTLSRDGIQLCTDTFGSPENPALLLIMGAGCSMLWWEEPFCQMLAKHGFFVIRYDNRDTGKSTCYPVGQPGYVFEDLADDAIAVLDGYAIDRALIMGMSMGGMLTQMIALRHPARLRGIILLSTMYFAEGAESLPYSSDEVNAFFASAAQEEATMNRDELVERTVRQWRITARSKRPFDAQRIRAIATADVDRADCYPCSGNHALAQVSGDALGRIAQIAAPTLVIHGTEDVVIPFIHGEMLANTIPRAALYAMEGAGHELHPLDYEAVIGEILARFSGR